jgi:site-specific DNA-cytosine methylase
MKVLDLFSGLGGWSQAFKDRGHDVVTVDIEKKFNPTICKDIMQISQSDFNGSKFDVILASPPCNCFSVASIYRHWNEDKTIKDNGELEAIRVVLHTIELIQALKPKFWVMENPTGMLRKVIGFPHYEISQCRYGRKIMKPTDLWGRLPESFIAKKCNPGNADHEKASRSSKSGVQGINNSFSNLGMRGKDERAKIAYGLSYSVCIACEKEIPCSFHGGLNK